MHLAVRLQLLLHYINRAIWSCPVFSDPLGLHTMLKRPRTRIKRTGPDLHLTDSIKPVSKPVRVLARVSGLGVLRVRVDLWSPLVLLCRCSLFIGKNLNWWCTKHILVDSSVFSSILGHTHTEVFVFMIRFDKLGSSLSFIGINQPVSSSSTVCGFRWGEPLQSVVVLAPCLFL